MISRDFKLKEYIMEDDVEHLTKTETDSILETLRKKLSTIGGVSLVEDYNGAFGHAGTIYLTMRWEDYEVTTIVKNVRDFSIFEQEESLRRCPK